MHVIILRMQVVICTCVCVRVCVHPARRLGFKVQGLGFRVETHEMSLMDKLVLY
jgi:hypothetical protein